MWHCNTLAEMRPKPLWTKSSVLAFKQNWDNFDKHSFHNYHLTRYFHYSYHMPKTYSLRSVKLRLKTSRRHLFSGRKEKYHLTRRFHQNCSNWETFVSWNHCSFALVFNAKRSHHANQISGGSESLSVGHRDETGVFELHYLLHDGWVLQMLLHSLGFNKY